MNVSVAMPPAIGSASQDVVNAAAMDMLKAAAALDVELDVQGFLQAWMTDGVRVFIARDGDEVRGFGLMVYGRRWHDARITASVLVAKGPGREKLLEFMMDTAKVLGAEVMFFEAEAGEAPRGADAGVRVVKLR
jgi:hypothetical protein